MGRGAADQAFDFMDRVVDSMEPIFARGADSSPRSEPPQVANVIEAKHALASGWRVATVKSAERGVPDTYFVTNGTDYAACSSKELAERICMLLGGVAASGGNR
jgi:hypothetical protein